MANNIWQGTISSDWGTADNWSLGVVPTDNDGHTVIFDATSPNCSLGSSNKNCNALDTSAYTNTLSFGVRTLIVSGDITLGGGTFSASTGGIAINATGNITSNGFVVTIVFQFQGNGQTYTLLDDLTVNGIQLSINTSGLCTLNGNNIYLEGGNCSFSASGIQGSTILHFRGNHTWSATSGNGCRLPVVINTTGTLTFGTTVRFANAQLTYIAGTVDTTTNSSMFICGASAGTTILDCSDINFYNFTVQASSTITLLEDLNIINQFTNTAALTINGFSLNLNSAILSLGGSQTMQGTTQISFLGANPVWLAGTGWLECNTFIKCTQLTLQASATPTQRVYFRNGTLTWVSGTVSADTPLVIGTSGATFDLDGVQMPTIAFTQGTTTLLSPLSADEIWFGNSSTVIFNGGVGFTVKKLSNKNIYGDRVVNRTLRLESGVTYNVTEEMDIIGATSLSSGNIRIESDTISVYTYLNLHPNAQCFNKYCNPIDIDSSGGRIVTTDKGVILRSLNWYITSSDAFEFF